MPTHLRRPNLGGLDETQRPQTELLHLHFDFFDFALGGREEGSAVAIAKLGIRGHSVLTPLHHMGVLVIGYGKRMRDSPPPFEVQGQKLTDRDSDGVFWMHWHE